MACNVLKEFWLAPIPKKARNVDRNQQWDCNVHEVHKRRDDHVLDPARGPLLEEGLADKEWCLVLSNMCSQDIDAIPTWQTEGKMTHHICSIVMFRIQIRDQKFPGVVALVPKRILHVYTY